MGETKHTAHAAMGKTRLRKSFVEKPDTIVKLPDGKTITLRRADKDVVPLFRKFDPRKFNAKSGKSKGRGGPGQGASMPSVIPFSKVIVTAFLLHQIYSFVKLRFFGRRRQPQPPSQQLVLWDEVTEEDLTEEQAAQLAAARKAQSAMAQAMLRNALPKPQRKSLPQRMSQAHHSRPRPHVTAKQKMTPNPDVKPRPSGMLEKVDEAMHREVRAVMAARRQLQQQQQQQQQLALPAPADPFPAASAS